MKFICDCGEEMSMRYRIGKNGEPYTIIFKCKVCSKEEEYGA